MMKTQITKVPDESFAFFHDSSIIGVLKFIKKRMGSQAYFLPGELLRLVSQGL